MASGETFDRSCPWSAIKPKIVAVGAGDETAVVIDWAQAKEAVAEVRQDAAWAKSLRLLKQILMNVLAEQGSKQRPYIDGPVVRAVDIEALRMEFYKSYPALRSQRHQRGFGGTTNSSPSRGRAGTSRAASNARPASRSLATRRSVCSRSPSAG